MTLEGQKIVVIGGSSGMGMATARRRGTRRRRGRYRLKPTGTGRRGAGPTAGRLCGHSPRCPRRDAGRRLFRASRRARSPGVHRRRRIHATPTCQPRPQRRTRDPRRPLLGRGRSHQARSVPDQARRINWVDHRNRRPATGPRRSARRRRRRSRRGPCAGTGGRTRPRPRQRCQGRRFSHAALGRRPRGPARALFARLAQGTLTGTVGEPEQIAAAHLYLMQNQYVTGTVQTVDGGLLLAGN